jgi:YebC/PmpR family DNA-binding regulatory protein
MAGHSKWANIKHRKGAQDKRRAKVFTRIIKDVMVAVKEGGPDPDANPRLRLCVQNAKGANIPKDTVQRAIAKASGKDADNYIETTYEGYGPNGIAIFLECTTDNINRTVQDIRATLNKHGGSLGTNGSLSFIFDRLGVFTIPQGNLEEDSFTMEMIDANATDVLLEDNIFTVYVPFESFGEMQRKLESMGIEAENASLQRIPKETTTLDIEAAKKVMKLIDALEEVGDVQQVYHNLELTEELVNQLD